MTQPALHHVLCEDAAGGRRMAYWQWGDPASAHVVLCMHGLTRQGRDFDALAQVLVARAGGQLRVVCPDVAGRGQSDWLRNPAGYQVPLYAADMVALLGRLHHEHAIETLDCIGTSMGGLIGMVLAGHKELPLPRPVRRLVINDVGPTIEAAALQRIGRYVGQQAQYANVQQAADALWQISNTFGPHTPDEWLALSRHMVVPAAQRSADGSAGSEAMVKAGDASALAWVLHYDPAIAVPLRAITPELAQAGEAVMWSLYDAIGAETLVTRGAQSDLLSRQTALAMTQRGPKARLVEFDGVGHAPTFVSPAQSDVVAAFLVD
ncbi:MAG: alpha/beta hydrolase [Variovorax sp.]|nr:MAG: alpha/beta hydrolase [Variovorax sp.]